MTREEIIPFICNGLACFALGVSLTVFSFKLKTPPPPVPAPVYAQADTLSDWQALTLAIALTESGCNPEATGKTQDAGILQLTPIYVREANRVGGTNYAHSDAYDPMKSLHMFRAVQDYHNPEHDQNKAIKLHNPGGASIGYPAKVKRNLELIKRMEAVRSVLKEYEHRKSNADNSRRD